MDGVDATAEWLVTSGTGGYAMGTPECLRTRRYHGLLVAPDPLTRVRHLGLVALEIVVGVGGRSTSLAGLGPGGAPGSFGIEDGVPRWRWEVGGVVLERTLALLPGADVVGVVDRLVAAPGPVRLAWRAWATWLPAGQVSARGRPPRLEAHRHGFVLDGRLALRWDGDRSRVPAPDGPAPGDWAHVRLAEEADRGYPAEDDVLLAGSCEAVLQPGEARQTLAWVGAAPDVDATAVISAARARTRAVLAAARVVDATDALLVHAADQFVTTSPAIDVVAGYPWFGPWSRDTLTAYEGLFLAPDRLGEGAALLRRLAGTVSQGMLANTADFGGTQYNTVDAALWFLHAVSRHTAVTGDLDLARELLPTLESIVAHHLAGTRYGIGATADGLLSQGVAGEALTWMDARVDGVPVTQRAGKPVEVNALWVGGLGFLADLRRRLHLPAHDAEELHRRAGDSFRRRFPLPGGGLADVVDSPTGTDARLRPNQLLAPALVEGLDAGAIARACAPLVTPLGLRSLGPREPGYAGRYAGPMPERDAVYHQGTVWPWLIGPWFDTLTRARLPTPGLLDGLVRHLGEAGLGSVSEVADGDPPHTPSGCPFQAWSVAELLRVRRQQG
jgi:glycogen debranching enzyme